MLKDIPVKLQIFGEGAQKFKNDRNLSELGKQRALGVLRAEMQAYKPIALSELKQEWKYIREKVLELEQQQNRAELESEERWNFERLNYYRANFEHQLAGLPEKESGLGGGSVEKLFQKVSSSAIPEQKRALFELLSTRSGGMAKQAKQALEELLISPEMSKLQETGSYYVKKAIELKKITEQAQNFYAAQGGGGGEFYSVSEGVKLSERFEPETGRLITTLETE